MKGNVVHGPGLKSLKPLAKTKLYDYLDILSQEQKADIHCTNFSKTTYLAANFEFGVFWFQLYTPLHLPSGQVGFACPVWEPS